MPNTQPEQNAPFLPLKYKQWARMPMLEEIMQLENELQFLLSLPNPTKHQTQLINYTFERCNRLWIKHTTPRKR